VCQGYCWVKISFGAVGKTLDNRHIDAGLGRQHFMTLSLRAKQSAVVPLRGMCTFLQLSWCSELYSAQQDSVTESMTLTSSALLGLQAA